MPVLSDVFVISLSSNVKLAPNRQFLDCATITLGERYVLKLQAIQKQNKK